MTSRVLLPIWKVTGIDVDEEGVPICQDIPREPLLSEGNYESVTKLIPSVKQYISSSYLTSLQSNAKETQKWPLINIVRQLLKHSGYRMIPIRKSNGYSKDGKKLFRRFFRIEKYKTVEPLVLVNEGEGTLD